MPHRLSSPHTSRVRACYSHKHVGTMRKAPVCVCLFICSVHPQNKTTSSCTSSPPITDTQQRSFHSSRSGSSTRTSAQTQPPRAATGQQLHTQSISGTHHYRHWTATSYTGQRRHTTSLQTFTTGQQLHPLACQFLQRHLLDIQRHATCTQLAQVRRQPLFKENEQACEPARRGRPTALTASTSIRAPQQQPPAPRRLASATLCSRSWSASSRSSACGTWRSARGWPAKCATRRRACCTQRTRAMRTVTGGERRACRLCRELWA